MTQYTSDGQRALREYREVVAVTRRTNTMLAVGKWLDGHRGIAAPFAVSQEDHDGLHWPNTDDAPEDSGWAFR